MRALGRVFLVIGTTSIGGGSSTLYLMRREIVRRFGWLSEREFLEDYVLSRLSLGIHLIAMAGLVGQRVAGVRGASVAVVAMLVPAGSITAFMTAGYAALRDHPEVQAAVAGMAPATLGMTAGVTLLLARAAARRGRRSIVDWSVLALSLVAGLVAPAFSYVVILAGAVLGAFVLRGDAPKVEED